MIEQAEVLLGEDAAGVVQILGELRDPEVTRYLLALAARGDLPAAVRARAIGAIEADQTWERDELAKLAHASEPTRSLRAAAVQAMGAFATSTELHRAHRRSRERRRRPAIRGALLWALQLARRPGDGSDGAAIAKLVEPMLDDADPVVRRRAAYVAGNLGLDKLAPALARRCAQTEPADLRLAAYVALGELGMPGVINEVVAAVRREDDPRVLGAASNALIAARPTPRRSRPLAGRARAAADGTRCARCAKPAPRSPACSAARCPARAIVPLATDDAPAVRGAAVWALGKLADPASEKTLLAAFRDDDATDPRARGRRAAPARHARRARAGDRVHLRRRRSGRARRARRGDPHPARARRAARAGDRCARSRSVDADDPAFEPLVRLKLATHVAARRGAAGDRRRCRDRDRVPELSRSSSKLSGFDALVQEPAHRRVAVPHDGQQPRRGSVAADHAVDEGARELRPRVARPAHGRPAARSRRRCSTTSIA